MDATVVGARFERERVVLGGQHFKCCTFIGCELVVDGRPMSLRPGPRSTCWPCCAATIRRPRPRCCGGSAWPLGSMGERGLSLGGAPGCASLFWSQSYKTARRESIGQVCVVLQALSRKSSRRKASGTVSGCVPSGRRPNLTRNGSTARRSIMAGAALRPASSPSSMIVRYLTPVS
jgi:hypothetical protein